MERSYTSHFVIQGRNVRGRLYIPVLYACCCCCCCCMVQKQKTVLPFSLVSLLVVGDSHQRTWLEHHEWMITRRGRGNGWGWTPRMKIPCRWSTTGGFDAGLRFVVVNGLDCIGLEYQVVGNGGTLPYIWKNETSSSRPFTMCYLGGPR